MKTLRWLCLMALLGLGGCASTNPLGYYWQAVNGHLQVLRAAQPVADWVADPATPEPLRQRLLLSQSMRDFAVRELALPDNASYRRYADLGRPAVVWNVVAAPALSLELKRWCFWVAGCVGYKGYYDPSQAEALAASLRPDWETAAYPVRAYSTLGWLNLLGGDPLLNTFIHQTEGELARLLFHELAHQVVYLSGDTAFNESFATAVERLGSGRWLDQAASPQARQAEAGWAQRRIDFRALSLDTRQALQTVYQDPALSDAEKHQAKAAAMAAFRARYQVLKTEWGGFSGYDHWVANANNAWFGVQAAYDQWVPAFEALFEQEGRDFARLYRAVEALAQLEKPAREARLLALMDNTQAAMPAPAQAASTEIPQPSQAKPAPGDHRP